MIDILRDYQPAVQWMQSLGDATVALPGFVVMELIQGCQTKRELTSPQEISTISGLLARGGRLQPSS